MHLSAARLTAPSPSRPPHRSGRLHAVCPDNVGLGTFPARLRQHRTDAPSFICRPFRLEDLHYDKVEVYTGHAASAYAAGMVIGSPLAMYCGQVVLVSCPGLWRGIWLLVLVPNRLLLRLFVPALLLFINVALSTSASSL